MLSAAQVGSGVQEDCDVQTPPGYNNNTAYIGIKSNEPYENIKFNLTASTDGVQTDNSRFVSVPYVQGTPISINLPNVPDYHSDKHLIYFQFMDEAGNSGHVPGSIEISTLPEPSCVTYEEGPSVMDSTCTCPNGFVFEGGQCL